MVLLIEGNFHFVSKIGLFEFPTHTLKSIRSKNKTFHKHEILDVSKYIRKIQNSIFDFISWVSQKNIIINGKRVRRNI